MRDTAPVDRVAAKGSRVASEWPTNLPVIGMLVLAFGIAAVVAWTFLTWGWQPALVAAGSAALGIIVPTWALVRVAAERPTWLSRVHAATIWVVAGVAVVLLAAGLFLVGYPFLQGTRPSLPAIGLIAAVVGVLVLVGTLLGARWGSGSNPIADMAAVRVAGWVLVGLAGTAAAVLPFVATYMVGSDMGGGASSMSAWQQAATANLGAAPALAFLLPHLGAWSTAILYTGLLAYGHHRGRERRVNRLETLRDRVQDHHARGWVTDATRALFLQHIDRERHGPLPAEASYLRARGAVARVGGMALLFLLVAGALVFLAVQVDPGPAGEAPSDFGDCAACTSVADYERYRSTLQDHRSTLFFIAGTSFVMAVYAALVVPLLLRRMQQARRDVENVWAERDELERRMLQEVRERAGGPA